MVRGNVNWHYAKLGDVWKHLPLAEVLRINPPRNYWETHAGSATYPLTESPARLHGALRFLARAPAEPDLAESAYLRVLRATPGTYPGSATLAMHILGNGARYVCCDTDPESAQSLGAAGARLDMRVIGEDGVSTIAREAAAGTYNSPSEVFVHIDPFDPHERTTPEGATPVELAARLASDGFRVMYWYGYDDAADRGWARREIARLAPRVRMWCGDVLFPAPFVYPEGSGASGCGVVLANVGAEEAATCARLGHALERMCADDVLEGNDPTHLAFREMT